MQCGGGDKRKGKWAKGPKQGLYKRNQKKKLQIN